MTLLQDSLKAMILAVSAVIGTALGRQLLLSMPKLVHQVTGLVMTDSAILTIKWWSFGILVFSFTFVGWFKFFRTRRKLRQLESDYKYLKDHSVRDFTQEL
jgi:hypothetical protein